MNEDGTAGQGTGSEQPGPDSSAWSENGSENGSDSPGSTPLNWSGQADPSPAPPAGTHDSPWARPTGATPPAGATPQHAPGQYRSPQYGAPQYGAPQYGSSQFGGVPPYGPVPPSGAPLGWPGSPYAAEPVATQRHGLTGAKLAIAGLALVVASAASSALIVNAIKSGGGGAVATSTQTPNSTGGGTQNAGNGTGGPSLNTAQIANAVNQGVVDITTNLAYQNASAAGTGMVLTSNGEILTNNHVIRGATTIKVTVVATGKTYTAKVVGTDPTDDVAVVQAQNASGLSTIPLGDSSTVRVGDAVVAIGNAGGTGGAPSVVTGSVTNLNQTITASDENGSNAEQLDGLIEVNAPIVAGDSGGPLANSSGKVIGMDTAASTTQARFSESTVGSQGYAIPINDALAIAKKIESGAASSTIHIGLPGFLGVEVADSSAASNSNGFGGFGGSGSTTSGAVVQGTTDNSPAAAAGISAGDVITSLNGTTVDSAQTLTSLLSGHHKGDQVTVGWTDSSGQTHTATITLAEGPAD